MCLPTSGAESSTCPDSGDARKGDAWLEEAAASDVDGGLVCPAGLLPSVCVLSSDSLQEAGDRGHGDRSGLMGAGSGTRVRICPGR